MPETYAPTSAAARVVHLTKTYGSGPAMVTALDDITLDLAAGQFTAVMGPSGSGKSTLMHCCAALDTADSGSVFIGEQDLSSLKDKGLTRLRRDEIGFVFQSYNLVPTLTAEENILLPLAIAGRKPDREWYDGVIATVQLADRLKHKPNELSGGQQQRVAVARALVSRPRIVFADEPTGNLDSRSGAEVLELLRRSVDEHGQTIVMVTHDPVAAAYTDRVVFLADGKVVDEMRSPDREDVLEVHDPDDDRGRGEGLSVFKFAWKSLLARKVRLLLSTFAIVLGVAFVVGSLVFTDCSDRSFNAIIALERGDVVVAPRVPPTRPRHASAHHPGQPGRRPRAAAARPGHGTVSGPADVFVVGSDGKLIGGNGPPGLGINRNGAPA